MHLEQVARRMAIQAVERLQARLLVLVHGGVETEAIGALDELSQVLLEESRNVLVLILA